MCGIAAIFNYGGNAPPVDPDELRRVTQRMVSRGPDGEGEWISPNGQVGLGHRRLSIIDLSPAGAQPMFNADRSVAIVFNGEIYNYQELRSKLAANGYRFQSHCDTEVLLALYETRGADAMLDPVRGMYAFAIWDDRRQMLFLARDPFGIKPLYYSDNGRTVRVASQVKALRAGDGIDLAPDPAGHVGFFLWGHVPDPFTMFRNIRSLPAGHTMCIDAHGVHSPKSFCSITSILAEADESGQRNEGGGQRTEDRQRLYSQLLRTSLAETVSYHLVADVPVGVFLSSGLDSTMITALAAEQGGDLRTVTLGFEEYKNTPADEVPLAEEFAKHSGAKHQTIWVSRADFEAERDHLFDAMDRPSTDGVNTFFVSLAAKQANLKVALSGVGGDELFASYPSFHDIPRIGELKLLNAMRGAGRQVRIISAPVLKRFTSPKYAGVFEYGGTYSGAYLLRRGMFMPWELTELLDPDFVKQGWAELQTLVRLDESVDGIRSPRLKVSALEMNWYMRHQLLRDSDWAGMGHSVEIRVPFVDIELLRQLAPLIAQQPGLTKREVAKSAISNLPSSIIDRPKTGFQVPVRDWLLAVSRRSKSKDRAFSSRPSGADRGLRGWAREVYSRFALTGQNPHVLTRRRRRRGDLAEAPRLQVLMLLSDAFGGFGGIAKFNRDFIRALASSDDVVKVTAVPRIMEQAAGDLPPKVEYATGGLKSKQSYVRAVLRAARGLRASTQFPVQPVIICGHINLLPAAIAASRISRANLYLIVHGIDAWEPTRDMITNAVVRDIDDFISVSAVTRRRFLRWSGLRQDQGIVLPNCVDLDAFRPAPKPPRLLDRYQLGGARVLMTLGRLASEERYKGFDEIIECLPEIGQTVSNLTYMVAGDGPDRLRLVEKAKSLGLRVDDYGAGSSIPGSRIRPSEGEPDPRTPRVIFVGRISDEEKADYVRLADLFVMPSSGEGFGIVLLEAMACGVPVIASKIDASREALREGKLGRLVDPRNAAEIKTAIMDCLANPPDRTQPIAGVEYFSVQRFEERVHAIVRSIRGMSNGERPLPVARKEDVSGPLVAETVVDGS